MMNFKKYLSITLPVLYVGLKNNWLTTKEVSALINANSDKFIFDEETLVSIYVNDDDKAAVLEILRKQSAVEENKFFDFCK